MSTRSHIGILNRDGSIDTHYLHSDGYYSEAARILFTHYQDRKKVQRLIDLGMQSVLGPVIGKKHDADWKLKMERIDGESWEDQSARMKEDLRSDWCVFFHRDRDHKEDWKPQHFESVEDFITADMAEQYLYLYDETRGAWIGCKTNVEFEHLKWHLLSDLAEAEWAEPDDWYCEDTTVRTVPLIDDNSPEQIVKALMPKPANDVERFDVNDPAARAIF